MFCLFVLSTSILPYIIILIKCFFNYFLFFSFWQLSKTRKPAKIKVFSNQKIFKIFFIFSVFFCFFYIIDNNIYPPSEIYTNLHYRLIVRKWKKFLALMCILTFNNLNIYYMYTIIYSLYVYIQPTTPPQHPQKMHVKFLFFHFSLSPIIYVMYH